jgi:hypothetical protein
MSIPSGRPGLIGFDDLPATHEESQQCPSIAVDNSLKFTARKQMTTPSRAQRTVLATPELLVLILSQLPHSSLLRAKLVNTTWASVFEFPEVQAALFLCPRPKNAALYAEPYSDLLLSMVLDTSVWPSESSDFWRFLSSKISPNLLNVLVCQPAVEYLEVIDIVSPDQGDVLEFRATIGCPEGLRLRFLVDAVKNWFYSSRQTKILWNRKIGDPADGSVIYTDGNDYKRFDRKPCITILVKTLLHGFLRRRREGDWTIRSGSKDITFTMSEPRKVRLIESFQPEAPGARGCLMDDQMMLMLQEQRSKNIIRLN